MGTNRFQKLYKSLTKDEAATVGPLKSSLSDECMEADGMSGWPRDSSMFLPEEIDEALFEEVYGILWLGFMDYDARSLCWSLESSGIYL